MALRALLSRIATRTGISLFPHRAHFPASAPALFSPDEAALSLSQCVSTFTLPPVGSQCRDEAVRFPTLLCQVYNIGVVEGGSEEQIEGIAQVTVEEPKAPIKPPRPFKLNNEQRELAEEIGYKVVEEDFGQNKRPKAFVVVQVGSHQFKVSPNDLMYT